MTEVAHDAAPPPGPGATKAPPRTRILVRADSQARSLGEGVVDRGDPRLWSAVLERSLREAGRDVEVENFGVAGLRIADALAGYERDRLVHARFDGVDTVILALGVNDWWPLARPRAVARAMERIRPVPLRTGLHRAYQRARPTLLRWSNGRFRPTDPVQARRDLERFVHALRRRHQVALVTPLPVSSPRNPGFDGNTVEAAAAVKAVARASGVPVVDTHELFEPVAWDEVSADHVHVNPAGHDVIGRAVAAAVAPSLTGDGDGPRREGDRLPGRDPSPPSVVVRCDVATLAPGARGDGRDASTRLALELQAALEKTGRAPGLVDGCFHGLDIEYLHHSVLHDPFVREPVAAAAVTVLGVAPPPRVSAYAREAYGWLVAVTQEITRPVLFVPPWDRNGQPTTRRFRALVDRVGRARGVPIVDCADLGTTGGHVVLEAVAERLAEAIDRELDGGACGPAPTREPT